MTTAAMRDRSLADRVAGVRGHRLLDPFVEAGDVGAAGVEAIQPGHERVMAVEPSAQRRGECRDLLTQALFGPDRRADRAARR